MVPRHYRRLGTVLVAVAAVLVTAAGQATPARGAASALPKLNITSVEVTGGSAGGYMANQLQVAYSNTFKAAGIVTAGPYDCGQGNVAVTASACGDGTAPDNLPALEQQAVTWSDQGQIDPISNLAGKPVYAYHGTADPVVASSVANDGVAFYQHFGANTQYRNTDPAGHAWVSPLGTTSCSFTASPYINNCGDDPEGEMLSHWFGSVQAPNTGTLAGTLSSYDQNQYAPGGNAPALSMDNTGMLYMPPACAAGQPCSLVVALHGCQQGQFYIGNTFATRSNIDSYADTNNLVVLYPQVIPSNVPYNPQGCWDWWGYDGSDFAVHGAPEMIAILNMVHALGG